MTTKIKGIYTKGFKYITQIFVVKEREMEIGYPTDVKHVAHIGWDGGYASGAAPSWMNEFKAAPEFSSTTAVTNTRDSNSNTLDCDESIGHKPMSHSFSGVPSSDLPSISKKQKRKKKKGSSSSSSSSSSRSSRARKSKASYHEKESRPSIEV